MLRTCATASGVAILEDPLATEPPIMPKMTLTILAAGVSGTARAAYEFPVREGLERMVWGSYLRLVDELSHLGISGLIVYSEAKSSYMVGQTLFIYSSPVDTDKPMSGLVQILEPSA